MEECAAQLQQLREKVPQELAEEACFFTLLVSNQPFVSICIHLLDMVSYIGLTTSNREDSLGIQQMLDIMNSMALNIYIYIMESKSFNGYKPPD